MEGGKYDVIQLTGHSHTDIHSHAHILRQCSIGVCVMDECIGVCDIHTAQWLLSQAPLHSNHITAKPVFGCGGCGCESEHMKEGGLG